MSKSNVTHSTRKEISATTSIVKKGFAGGLSLGKIEGEPSADVIKEMPLSPMLWMSLDQRGTRLKPIVDVGEKVVPGQILTATNDTGLVLIASASGEICNIDQHIVIRTEFVGQKKQTPNSILSKVTESTARSMVHPVGQRLQLELQSGLQLGQLLDTLQANGILGQGGAAFPSGRKISVACKLPLQTLIINACECEPLVSCDQALIRHHATDIVAGIQLLVDALQPDHCIVGIEDSMSVEIELLQSAIDRAAIDRAAIDRAAIDRAAIDRVTIDQTSEGKPGKPLVKVVPSVFPAGSERQLIKSLLGIAIPAGKKPADQGIVTFNVATVYAIKLALVDKTPPISRIVSVTGTAITQPCNITARYGTPVGEVALFVEPHLSLAALHEIDIVQGGAMTGKALMNQSEPITAATNCLQFNHKTNAPVATACIRCGYCTDVCPEELIPQQLLWYLLDKDLESANLFNLDSCIECACCDYVCPANIPLTQIFQSGKHENKEQFRLQQLAKQAQHRTHRRNERLEKQLKQKEERIVARKKSLSINRNNTPNKDAIKAALERARNRKSSQ